MIILFLNNDNSENQPQSTTHRPHPSHTRIARLSSVAAEAGAGRFRRIDHFAGGRRSMIVVRAWKWYQKCLYTHPLKTQIVSSGVLWGVGDIAAQTVTRSSLSSSSISKNSPQDAVIFMVLSSHLFFFFFTFCTVERCFCWGLI